ncbi:alpha/beta fold hydrolase [Streptomyces puniciscabiei]|uniref:alpha/beta fold hydrolase n=1 Tax=Streptomyces puniciscabiei TaxID=164348 RepID=UPI00332647E8
MYAPHLRGHGDSDWPRDCRAEVMSEGVLALPAALGLDGADVVGQSPGGIVARLLAQRHPGAVRRLVLEDVCALLPLDRSRPPAERPAGSTTEPPAATPAARTPSGIGRGSRPSPRRGRSPRV